MPKSRVLVVDDAVVVRKILTDVLSAELDIEVVGTAANGKICLQKIPQVNPEIITLDFEMPEMNGLETLKEIKRLYPKIPVIMFSALTEKGAALTLDALSLGASDYVTKPAQMSGLNEAKEKIRQDLITKIRSLLGRLAPVTSKSGVSVPSNGTTPQISFHKGTGIVNCICLAVSTGGPNALVEVIPKLPRDIGVPVLMVQHMPPMFTKILAERLSAGGNIPVHEATDGMLVNRNNVYLAPGDFHMELKRDGNLIRTSLNQGPQENSCRPAADPLFRSAVSIYGGNILGVVMTGMGHDGMRGCQSVREAGGEVIIQDEKSSVVWGMPGAVYNAGLANAVYPLSELANQISMRVKKNRDSARSQSTTGIG